MSKLKISVVSYLNSKVFIKGLIPNAFENFDISLDIPSVCADKLIKDQVDIGLIPVAVIPEVPNATIVSNYCISANKSVNSVFLFSNTNLNDLHTIYLDRHSRTSNMLCKILCKELWNIAIEFKERSEDIIDLKHGEGFVLIGDRTFNQLNNFTTKCDLASAWYELTSLPFVFATWVSNKILEKDHLSLFNQYLSNGFNYLDDVIKESELSYFDVNDYLKNKIEYNLNDEKRNAIQIYLDKSMQFRT